LKQLDCLAGVPRLTVFLFQQWLVIESINMACGSRHEELDDSFGLRWMVSLAGVAAGHRKRFVTKQQIGQSQPGETAKAMAKKPAAIIRGLVHQIQLKGPFDRST
jgi:hypothetical protein